MKFTMKLSMENPYCENCSEKNTNQKEVQADQPSTSGTCHEQLNISGQLRMAELTPLAAAQAEVDEVSGILKDNLGKVKMMEKVDGWQ